MKKEEDETIYIKKLRFENLKMYVFPYHIKRIYIQHWTRTLAGIDSQAALQTGTQYSHFGEGKKIIVGIKSPTFHVF